MGIQKKDREYERFLDQISDFIFVEDKPEKADILFVPGNGFPQMSIEAARLWKEGMAPWILPSGKYSIGKGAFAGVQAMQENYPGPYQTEWEFMKDVLRKEGVPEEVILREDAATFTYQNAINSRKVTDEAGIRVKKAIICCKAQHARRCKLYYQYLYPQTTFHLPFGCGVNREKLVRYAERTKRSARRSGKMRRTAAADLLQGSGFLEYLNRRRKTEDKKKGGCYGSICGTGSGDKNLSDGRSDD